MAAKKPVKKSPAKRRPRKSEPPKSSAPAAASKDGSCCHGESPKPPPRDETPHPSIPRSELAGHGKPVTVHIHAPGTGPGHRYVRADIEILGIEHDGATYEGRVFLNNAKATAKTPTDAKQGFAGRFVVFGHGQCFGGAGHCELPKRYRAEDRRRSHPLERIAKQLTATEAVRRAAAKSPDVTVTIVPVLQAATRGCELDDVVRFENVRLVTYNA